MIESTLENIRKYLELKFGEAGRGDWKVHLDTINKDGDMDSAIYITLLRIEEETSRKKQNIFHRTGSENGYYAAPDLCVNLYILISSHAENYNTGLMQISTTMSILNTIYDFAYVDKDVSKEKESDQKANVYAAVQSLSIELQSMTAEQNNSLWQTLGCKVMPAVCYKVRLLTISDETNRVAAPIVRKSVVNVKR